MPIPYELVVRSVYETSSFSEFTLKTRWFDFCLGIDCVCGLSLTPEVASKYDLYLSDLWFCMPLETRLDVLSNLLLGVFSTLMLLGCPFG